MHGFQSVMLADGKSAGVLERDFQVWFLFNRGLVATS